MLFLFSFVVFALAVLGMAVGLFFGRPPIAGSCGGVQGVQGGPSCGRCRRCERAS